MSNVLISIAAIRIFSQLAVYFEDPSLSLRITLADGAVRQSCRWGLGGSSMIYLFSLDLLITLLATGSIGLLLLNSWLDVADQTRRNKSFDDAVNRRLGNIGKGKSMGSKKGGSEIGIFEEVFRAFLVKVSVLICANIAVLVALALPDTFGFHAVTLLMLHSLVNLLLVGVDWRFLVSVLGRGRKPAIENRASHSSASIQPSRGDDDDVEALEDLSEDEEYLAKPQFKVSLPQSGYASRKSRKI